MVAFRLPATTNLQAIVDGHRDVVLARPPRSPAADRLPGVGGRVHLSTPATATFEAAHLPARRVIFRADVSFSADGVVRVIEAESRHPGTVEGVHALLLNAEQGSGAIDRRLQADVFARRAGFADYADLWRSLRASDADVVHRVVIQWGNEL
jgi:hypothetical protein